MNSSSEAMERSVRRIVRCALRRQHHPSELDRRIMALADDQLSGSATESNRRDQLVTQLTDRICRVLAATSSGKLRAILRSATVDVCLLKTVFRTRRRDDAG